MVVGRLMRVLVVEDEIKMAALLKQGLEEQNHSVEVAYDGKAAMEIANNYEFDVIVLDVMLPRLDGFEVARRLRTHTSTTPSGPLGSRMRRLRIPSNSRANGATTSTGTRATVTSAQDTIPPSSHSSGRPT